MKLDIRRILGLLVTFAFVFVSCTVRAEVTRVEISSRQDVLGGKSFGPTVPKLFPPSTSCRLEISTRVTSARTVHDTNTKAKVTSNPKILRMSSFIGTPFPTFFGRVDAIFQIRSEISSRQDVLGGKSFGPTVPKLFPPSTSCRLEISTRVTSARTVHDTNTKAKVTSNPKILRMSSFIGTPFPTFFGRVDAIFQI